MMKWRYTRIVWAFIRIHAHAWRLHRSTIITTGGRVAWIGCEECRPVREFFRDE